MIKFEIIDFGSSQYKQMLDLRHRILRAPINLVASEEELAKDKNYTLLGGFSPENGVLLACCFLSHIDDDVVQLRQMAVDNIYQGQGLGRQLITYAEQIAEEHNYKTMYLHARGTAVGFYEKLGYKIQGDYFTEVGIPHLEMTKSL